LQVIREAEVQTNVLSEKVEEMEQVLQKLHVSTNSMDSSRTKQFSKFTSTVKRLSELQQQTEVQPPEVKGHHCDIETQDTQIPQPAEILMADGQGEEYSWAIMNANTEITGLREDMLAVQKSPDIKNSELNGIQSKLAAMLCNQDIAKGTFAEDFDEVQFKSENQVLTTTKALIHQLENHQWQSNTERKYTELHMTVRKIEMLTRKFCCCRWSCKLQNCTLRSCKQRSGL
jgi:hypothetical protein